MATGSRTLKLSILGDVTNLNKSLKTADNDVNSFAGGLEKFSARAGKAFALAGAAAVAYAGKLAIDGVKAAIEDEAAQAKLAKTLENVTGATDQTIKATEDYILQTSLAFGVTDEQLRPSLERLVRATKDVEEAQKLQSLALDISAGSGKSLESVSNALAKAAEGQTTALGKLGVGIDAADLKTMNLDQITKTLSDTFGGQAQAKTETYQGKMDKLKVAFDEAKESVGTALLPIITKMADYISTNMVPALNSFIAGLTGKDSVNESLTKTQETALAWGKRIKGLIGTIINFKDEILFLGATLATVFAVSAISGWVAATVTAVGTLIKLYNALKASAIVAGVASAFALNPLLGVGAVAVGAGVLAAAAALSNQFNTVVPGSKDLTGMEATGLSAGLYGSTPVNPGATKPAASMAPGAIAASASAANKAVAAATAPKFVSPPIGLPAIDPATLNYQDSFRTSPMNTYNVTVNGALNSEQTARQIVSILNDSQARGTQGATQLVTTSGAIGF